MSHNRHTLCRKDAGRPAEEELQRGTGSQSSTLAEGYLHGEGEREVLQSR